MRLALAVACILCLGASAARAHNQPTAGVAPLTDGIAAAGPTAELDRRPRLAGLESVPVMAIARDAALELRTLASGLEARLDPSGAARRQAADALAATVRETGAFLGGLDRTIGRRSPLWSGLGEAIREHPAATGTLAVARRLALCGTSWLSPSGDQP